ncbi:MAG: glycogen debranching N-terminal domain-containing protein [Barnesiella intestinihominis]
MRNILILPKVKIGIIRLETKLSRVSFYNHFNFLTKEEYFCFVSRGGYCSNQSVQGLFFIDSRYLSNLEIAVFC